MRVVKIAGKDYKVSATVQSVRQILKKYEIKAMDKWEDEMFFEFSLDLLWQFLRRRWYGFKPFIYKSRFERLLDQDDLLKAQETLIKMLHGQEEREPGKEKKSA